MKLREIFYKVKKDVEAFKFDINDRIAGYNDQKVQLQAKIDGFFDEQAAAELNGKSFDCKEIDRLSAEIVRLNGLITALERQAKKEYSVPESDRQEMIKVAATEYVNDSIKSIQGHLRLEEINEQLWKLMEEQKGIISTKTINLNDEFEYCELFSNEDIADMISRVEKEANIFNIPEVIKLNKQSAELKKSNYPYFWKKYFHSSEVRDLIYEAQHANKLKD